MENWRKFVELSDDSCGVLYLRENKEIVEVSFDNKLSMISENNEEQINEFLQTWSESVDYALSQDILEEGVMDIVKQAASTLKTLGTKSWDTILSVSQKILGFIERFKEEHPTTYKMIKYAIIAVVVIGLLYLIAKATGMTAVVTAMNQLASLQIPDVAISEIVRDFTSQGTVDALRHAVQLLQDHIGQYLGEMIASDTSWIHDLGVQLQGMFGNAVETTAMDATLDALLSGG
jgi:hypothetical protein